MSALEMIPNPERYAPGSPWSSHDWDDRDPLWSDSAWWCHGCGVGSFQDGAHETCIGRPRNDAMLRSQALLVQPRKNLGVAA